MEESWRSFHAKSRPCQSGLLGLARLSEGTRSRDIPTGSWLAVCLLLANHGTPANVDCHMQGPAWPAVVDMFCLPGGGVHLRPGSGTVWHQGPVSREITARRKMRA